MNRLRLLLLGVLLVGCAGVTPATPTTVPTQIVTVIETETVPVLTATAVAPVATPPSTVPPNSPVAETPKAPRATGEQTLPMAPPTWTPSPAPPPPTPLPPTPPPPTPTPQVRGVIRDPDVPARGRVWTIALDPGHGGPEFGAATDELVEKTLNLQIALALADLLVEDGYRVVLTRVDDGPVHPNYEDASMRSQVTLDLQARVDIANATNADLFLSIHNNGSGDPDTRGTEVWYNRSRPFSDRNEALAEMVLENLVGHLRAIGHPTVNRGIKEDSEFRIFRGQPFNIYVLGPGTGARPHVATQMPGVLGESLFLSNPTDAAALARPATHLAIAQGYYAAIEEYVARFGS